jgi:hypothetical protein
MMQKMKKWIERLAEKNDRLFGGHRLRPRSAEIPQTGSPKTTQRPLK